MGMLPLLGVVFLIILLVVLCYWRKELWQWFVISLQPDWLNWKYEQKKEICFAFVADEVTDVSLLQDRQIQTIDDYRILNHKNFNYCYAKDYEKLYAWLAKHHQYVPWTTQVDNKTSFDQQVYFKKKV